MFRHRLALATSAVRDRCAVSGVDGAHPAARVEGRFVSGVGGYRGGAAVLAHFPRVSMCIRNALAAVGMG
jgi:hypothetical protein